MVDYKKKLWKWGPIDGLPIYYDSWHIGLDRHLKLYPPGWPENISYSCGEKVLFVTEHDKLYKNATETFEKYIFNNRSFNASWKKWQQQVKLIKAAIKFVRSQKLYRLSNFDFYKLVSRFMDVYYNFWTIGLLPELANLGGAHILARELGERIKNNEDYHYALEKLSAPDRLSFFQKEELDLLRIKDITDKASLQKKLRVHQGKYFWLLNSYHHGRVLPLSYFKRLLSKQTKLSANRRIEAIKKITTEAKRNKRAVIRQYRLPQELIKISDRLSFCIWWQDLRKAYIFQVIHIIDLFLAEGQRRYGVSADSLRYYIMDDFLTLLSTGRAIPKSEIRARRGHFLSVWRPGRGVKRLSGRKAKNYVLPYLNKKVGNKIKEIRGVVVSPGRVKGRVWLAHTSNEAVKIKKGDILVTPMTSPDYIVAMRKAGAIITDEGGVTSHAAIVSRELKKPCIVGTKIATKLLKHGDMVEVDAVFGLVKII